MMRSVGKSSSHDLFSPIIVEKKTFYSEPTSEKYFNKMNVKIKDEKNFCFVVTQKNLCVVKEAQKLKE